MKPATHVDQQGRVHRSKTITHTPCDKQGYTSRELAATAAAIRRLATGDNITAYKCRDGCHCWHIGHTPWWAQ